MKNRKRKMAVKKGVQLASAPPVAAPAPAAPVPAPGAPVAAPIPAAPADSAPAQPWPNSLAAKVLASYLHLKYGLSAADLRFFNPVMGAMPFFNNSATPEVRHDELALVAAAIMKFLLEIGIDFAAGKTGAMAHADLLAAMEPESNRSSGMVEALDANYRFEDDA